jgi:hypothetical protein
MIPLCCLAFGSLHEYSSPSPGLSPSVKDCAFGAVLQGMATSCKAVQLPIIRRYVKSTAAYASHGYAAPVQ